MAKSKEYQESEQKTLVTQFEVNLTNFNSRKDDYRKNKLKLCNYI